MQTHKIAIIGAGPAGCAAAVQCARLGAEPFLIDRKGGAGGLVSNAFCVENYPGVEAVDGRSFAVRLGDHLNNFNVPVTKGEVKELVRTIWGYVISGEFGRIHACAVIVAVGTSARLLEIPGSKEHTGKGLFYEVEDLLGTVASPKKVLVIGAGEAALDYSLTLQKAGANVSILVRGDKPAARGRLLEMIKSQPDISIHFNAVARKFESTQTGMKLCLDSFSRVQEAQELEADAVLAAIGRHSCAQDLLEGLDVGPLTGVSTRIPGLFVVGDARSGGLGQIGMAVGDGLAAANVAVESLER